MSTPRGPVEPGQRANTPRGYPYPLRSWPPDTAVDIQQLAEAVDTDVASNYLTRQQSDSRYLLSGFRNVIRNGDMSIAQRGNGPYGNGMVGQDGWLNLWAGGTVTANRVVQAPGLGSPLITLAVSGQSAATDCTFISQRVESVSTLADRTVTVSFLAKATSGAPKVAIEFLQYFGSGGSPSASQSVLAGTVTIGTTLTRYSLTFTTPSIVGKTLGTSGNDRAELNLWLSSGANIAGGQGIGIQNNTFSITDVQLEAGPVATPFERLPVQQQLAWCQRYFQRIGASNPNMAWIQESRFGQGYWIASPDRLTIQMTLPAPMRAVPTVAHSTPWSDFAFYDGVAGWTATNAGVSAGTTTRLLNMVYNVTPTTGTQYRAVEMYGTNGYIDLSAEL